MTDVTNIPLSKLIGWEGNVRRTGITDGLDELAASIAAHGLLQSLVVRKAGRGKFAVVAGQRRLLALKRLRQDRTIEEGFEVPCRIIAGDASATEISLAENVVRAPMHPADQFEAFRDLIDDGAAAADVAARFGVSESLVIQRLRLGRLSPVILTAYREAEIGLDQAQAFAISEDHAAQERVWAELPEWNRDARSIRRALTDDEVPATDKRVRFVGLEAYEEAGGAVRRDLFDERNAGYVQDEGLLGRLATEKLEAAAGALRGEGWKWVECCLDLDYEELRGFSWVHPVPVALSPEAEAELEALAAEYDSLADDEDGEDAQASERLATLEQEIEAIREAASAFTPEMLDLAGAIVTLDHQGRIDIRRGLVRPEDARRESDEAGKAMTPASPYSAKLVEDLTAQKTSFIRAELARRPDVALAGLLHALALKTFYRGTHDRTCLAIELRSQPLEPFIAAPEACKGVSAFGEEHSRLSAVLPEDPDLLWSWCQTLPQEEMLRALAVCVASSLDGVQRRGDRPESGRLAHADALARTLRLDLADWFTPTAANFFGRISRAAILTVLEQARGKPCAPALAKLKKDELALKAEREIAGTGWWPEPLRIEDAPSE